MLKCFSTHTIFPDKVVVIPFYIKNGGISCYYLAGNHVIKISGKIKNVIYDIMSSFQGFDGSVTKPNGPVGQGAEGVINKAMSEPAVEIELAPKDVVVGMPLDHVIHDDVPWNPPPLYEEGLFYICAPDYNDVFDNVTVTPPPSYEEGTLYRDTEPVDESADNAYTPPPPYEDEICYIHI